MFNYEINVKTLTYLRKINVILYIHIFDGKLMTPNELFRHRGLLL